MSVSNVLKEAEMGSIRSYICSSHFAKFILNALKQTVFGMQIQTQIQIQCKYICKYNTNTLQHASKIQQKYKYKYKYKKNTNRNENTKE